VLGTNYSGYTNPIPAAAAGKSMTFNVLDCISNSAAQFDVTSPAAGGVVCKQGGISLGPISIASSRKVRKLL
jgi:hypothetical protein